MRTHRNSAGQVECPPYEAWAVEECAGIMGALSLAMAMRITQRLLHMNDWQVREVLRKWAEEQANETE